MKSISELKQKVATLEINLETTNKNLNTYKDHTKSLETNNQYLFTKIQDIQNRSMRSNLVFHGLPETEEENKGNNENDNNNYDQTKEIVAKYVSQHLGKDFNVVANTIVRAHRSRRKSNNASNTKPRPIFVKFNRDDIAADFLNGFIRVNIAQKKSVHRVEQQFTKELQDRRRNAFQHKKELLESGNITKGRITYPAILRGIYKGSKTFVIIQEH